LAIQQYNTSTQLNPNFFCAYLQRGQAKFKLQQINQAKIDLEKSLTLLPTGNAFYVLGLIAQKQGNPTEAKSHYTQAAGNKGELAIDAYTALLELNLNANPDQYLKLRIGKTNQGSLAAEVENMTPKTIGGLQILLQTTDSLDRPVQIKQSLQGQVAAETKHVFNLNVEGLSDKQLQSLQAKLIGAKLIP